MLSNNNTKLQINNDKISIIGVDYAGTRMHFGDYADLDNAMQGIEKDDF